MKRKTAIIGALAAGAGLALAPASFCDELIRFKTGYEMMVASHREEKGLIIVTLQGGGEVGFQKDLIETLEGGKTGNNLSYSPLFGKVPSRVHVGAFIGKPKAPEPSRFLAQGTTHKVEGATVGYSYAGQEADRFSGGPLGPVNGSGKIGVDIRSRGVVTHRGGDEDQSTEYKKQKSQARTLSAILPGEQDGD
jgi:hypothetical protein